MKRMRDIIHVVAEMARALGRPMSWAEAESVVQMVADSASLFRLCVRPRTPAREARRARLLTQILLNAKSIFGPVELEVPAETDVEFYVTARRPSGYGDGEVVFILPESLFR